MIQAGPAKTCTVYAASMFVHSGLHLPCLQQYDFCVFCVCVCGAFVPSAVFWAPVYPLRYEWEHLPGSHKKEGYTGFFFLPPTLCFARLTFKKKMARRVQLHYPFLPSSACESISVNSSTKRFYACSRFPHLTEIFRTHDPHTPYMSSARLRGYPLTTRATGI